MFNYEMLVLARESRGLNQTDLAALAGVQQGTISKIESGLLQPSADLIELFSARLHYPPAFFAEHEPVYGFNATVFFHRKRQSLPDRVLRKLHAQVNISRMRVKKLKRSLEIDAAFRFQAMEPLEYGGPAGVARLVRQMWQMPPGPVRDLIQVIEDAGGIVIEFDFGTKQADAISEWVPNSPPIFVLNSNAEISWDRRRLTLAHELGHIILHKLGPNPQMEDEANEFAAEFLMPRREIKPSLYGLTMAKLRDLKRYWKVSMQALVERAYQLKTITLNQRKYFYISLNKNGHTRVHEPMEFEFLPEKPQLFHSMLRAHLEKLDYSMRELATLLFFEEAATLEAELFGEKGPRLIVA